MREKRRLGGEGGMTDTLPRSLSQSPLSLSLLFSLSSCLSGKKEKNIYKNT